MITIGIIYVIFYFIFFQGKDSQRTIRNMQ